MPKSDNICLSEAAALCPLFSGLSGEEMTRALAFFHARILLFEKGEYIKKPGVESVPGFFGFVISGAVRVSCDDYDGNRMIMASVGPGHTFGESMCFLKTKNTVYIEAAADTVLLAMDCDCLQEEAGFQDDLSRKLTVRFTRMLALRTLSMNSRVQVLSKLSLREKIVTFLSQQPGASSGRPFEISMSREDMASWLGANRAALSRELSALRKEGNIDYHKNTFRILHKEAGSPEPS